MYYDFYQRKYGKNRHNLKRYEDYKEAHIMINFIKALNTNLYI